MDREELARALAQHEDDLRVVIAEVASRLERSDAALAAEFVDNREYEVAHHFLAALIRRLSLSLSREGQAAMDRVAVRLKD